jgi:dihydrofolate reductase
MNFIVAVDNNYAIGKNNDLLYSLKQDMKYFRETTLNKVVVMGDKTLLSFPNSAPLKNRTNIVVSIDPNFTVDGAIVVHSFKELFEELKKYDTNDIFVIGGASIYNQLMDYCEFGYITKIDAEKPYDKAINNVEKMGWELVSKSETLTENDLNFAFCIFKNPNVKIFEE